MSALSRRSRTRSKQSSSVPAEQQDDLSSPAPSSLAMADLATSPQPTSQTHPTNPDKKSKSIQEVDPDLSELEQQISMGVMADAPDDEGDDANGSRPEHDDGRSSSLSDIDDDVSEDQSDDGTQNRSQVQENDSEAETERLENSPHKLRKNKDVIISSHTQKTVERTTGAVSSEKALNHQASLKSGSESLVPNDNESVSTNGVRTGTGKSALSTVDTPLNGSEGEEEPKTNGLSKTSSKKRKLEDAIESDGPAPKKTGSIKDVAVDTQDDDAAVLEDSEVERDDDGDAGNPSEGVNSDEDEPPQENGDGAVDLDDATGSGENGTPSRKGKKGRRRGARNGEEPQDPEEDAEMPDDEVDVGHAQDEEAKVGDEEDVVEPDGELGEAEAAARNEEELAKKKSAMDSLGTIEKHFATFRDRLYDERLAQLDNELALLTQPNSTHSDLQAMVRALDSRRDEKIEVEQVVLRYKIETLETKTVAERSQIHSQFFQTVRGIREKKMEDVGAQWYQIQRDRRNWNGSPPDYTYRFPTRRSQQLMQQASYNLEVSILAGVARHVGFPAAPSIEGARATEVDDDLKAMGITPNAPSRPSIHKPRT